MATPAILSEHIAPTAPHPTRFPRLRASWIQAVLFLITLTSTSMVGMRYSDNFRRGLFPLSSDADIFPYRWVAAHLSHLAQGLPFSLTLLGILLTHEFGHYFACRAYGIRATLPYLLPAPSLSGTAGAVISLKSRVKTRAALVSIGAFGPLAGFLVALIMTTIGIALSRPVAIVPTRLIGLNSPLLFKLLAHLFHRQLDGPLVWHPILLASWIGLLITSLNLIPAGQLDGGHILYAISPRLHRVSTWVVLAVLLYLGIFHWMGWLLWAGMLLLPGMRHPRVQDETPLTKPIRALALTCLALFLLTATPEPFQNANLLQTLHWLRH